jgi:hypothetical protein
MATLAHHHPAAAEHLREAAMKLLARGDTGEILRSRAANVRYVRRLAADSGIAPADVKADLLDIAGDIEAVEGEGLTPLDCYLLLGLDKGHASYEAFLEKARRGC